MGRTKNRISASFTTLLGALALSLFLPAALTGQVGSGTSPDTSPICPGVEDGRVAVLVGEGESEREVRERLAMAGDTMGVTVLPMDDAGVRLVNRCEVQHLLSRSYPPASRNAGRGGEVVFIAHIDADGAVRRADLAHGAGETELDEAAKRVVESMRFTPALVGGCRLPALMRVPVTWAVPR